MKSLRVQTGQCYVHRGMPVDLKLLHEHHIKPQGYGGEDVPENRTWLCGSCHDLVHRLAQFLNSKKQGLAVDLAQQYQASQGLSPAGRQRLLQLASTVATSIQQFDPDAAPQTDAEEDTVIVSLYMPRSLHRQLKTLAAGHTNLRSGRQMGLYRYILRVLQNHATVYQTDPAHARDPKKLYSLGQSDESAPVVAEGLTQIE